MSQGALRGIRIGSGGPERIALHDPLIRFQSVDPRLHDPVDYQNVGPVYKAGQCPSRWPEVRAERKKQLVQDLLANLFDLRSFLGLKVGKMGEPLHSIDQSLSWKRH
jgi:hypothetical protein